MSISNPTAKAVGNSAKAVGNSAKAEDNSSQHLGIGHQLPMALAMGLRIKQRSLALAKIVED
jgi:hypothetical protein